MSRSSAAILVNRIKLENAIRKKKRNNPNNISINSR